MTTRERGYDDGKSHRIRPALAGGRDRLGCRMAAEVDSSAAPLPRRLSLRRWLFRHRLADVKRLATAKRIDGAQGRATAPSKRRIALKGSLGFADFRQGTLGRHSPIGLHCAARRCFGGRKQTRTEYKARSVLFVALSPPHRRAIAGRLYIAPCSQHQVQRRRC